jgi:catechol 2,3-dioxygenase-like lactoylglutathione lyase family enzyme
VTTVRKLQTQGVHHITLNGADRQTSIDFWEGVLGMPFVFEQPNLDRAEEGHLYFDPGDGRLITTFTNEDRTPDPSPTSRDVGSNAPDRRSTGSRRDDRRGVGRHVASGVRLPEPGRWATPSPSGESRSGFDRVHGDAPLPRGA